MEQKNTLGRQIKIARAKLGLSQAGFGELFGVQHQAVGSWERDEVVPPQRRWGEFKEKCGIDIAEIMSIQNKNITIDNQSMFAGKSIMNPGNGLVLSAAEQALVSGLRKLGEKEDETIFEFLGMISKMLKNQ